MRYANALVSVGLPVRNWAARIEAVVKSVLAEDRENLELVICDNASTDETEELCRDLAVQESRIVITATHSTWGSSTTSSAPCAFPPGCSFAGWATTTGWRPAIYCVASTRGSGRRPADPW
jgi:cellulose synthase/poly-beta-1,6-N-acetylglucosamine synthase-like glycosyltransferase